MSEDQVRRGTAVITGGSGAIGMACGRALVDRGYDVVLTSRTEPALRESAASIGARYVAADSADPSSFLAVVEAAGTVDVLVHAAGILRGTFVRKERIEDFDAVLRTNLRSCFVVTQAVLPAMGVGGRIVFISSTSSIEPMRGRTAYSAAKAGMNAFAEALRGEVARDGIHVNVVIPGPVETPMIEDVAFEMFAIKPEDVAAAVEFLDSLDPRVAVAPMTIRAVASGPLAPPPTNAARNLRAEADHVHGGTR